MLPSHITANRVRSMLEKYSPASTSGETIAQSQPFTVGSKYYSPVTYYWPDYYNGDSSQWNKVLRFGSDLGIVVLNRNSGDWEAFDNDFLTQAKLAKGAGAKRTIFYVKTQYGVAGNPTRWDVGVTPNPEKFSHEYILKQLAFCKQHYGELFEGVFLDEFINGWGDHEERIPWYKTLVDAIRKEYGPSFTIVGNCGSNCNEGVLALDVDVFMSYESTAEKYLKDDPRSPIHPAHMAQHPGTRFWHVVHDVTTENYRQVFDKAEKLGIGHLYITDGKLVMGAGGQWQPDINPYAVAPGQWITDLLKPWLRGILDTRLKVEESAQKIDALESKVSSLPKPAPAFLSGTGFPEGKVSAPTGSRYVDTAATNGAVEWLKTSGSGNSGWVVTQGNTGWRDLGNNLRIMRMNNTVRIFANGSNVARDGSVLVRGLPPGFVTSLSSLNVAYTNGGSFFRSASIGNDGTVNTSEALGANSSIEFLTDQAWPTTLPGTAVGGA